MSTIFTGLKLLALGAGVSLFSCSVYHNIKLGEKYGIE